MAADATAPIAPAADRSHTPTLASSDSSAQLEKDVDRTSSPPRSGRPAAATAPGAAVHDAPVSGVSAGDAAAAAAATDKSELARAATATSQAGGAPVQQTRTRDDGTEYPTGVKLALITLALCLSVFCMALDNSIIATAIPKITDQFHSLDDVGWYGSAYLLTTASLQLLFGRFYSFFSIKWVYLIAIGIFELGSLICGAANSSTTLIVGRAIAGVGSAGIFSGALIILAHSVPLVKRPMYTGFIGSMYGIASVSGPLLGGVFTDKATWRWCFYINLPIGAITVVVIAIFFPDPHQVAAKDEPWRQRIMHFDPLGTIVFTPAVVCLLLALQWGGTKYSWDSARIIVLFVLFGLLIAAFIAIQAFMGDLATVPPIVARKRTVWSGCIFSFCLGAAFLLSIYFLPIWFQAVKGASAVRSGIMNLPMLIATVVLSILAGIVVTLVGYYTPFMLAGSVFMAVGYGLISTFDPNTSSSKWIGYQILAGAGVGLGMQQPMMAVQVVLDIKYVPVGTSLIVFLQTLGGALFISIGENIFTNKLTQYVVEYVPGLDPKSVIAAGATSIQHSIPKEMLPGVILAYNNALTKVFLVCAATAAASIVGSLIIEWKSVKGKKIEMAAA